MLVQIGIASYDGKVCAATTDALLAETVIGYGRGIHFLVDWVSGNALVACARNILVERFLQVEEAECLVMIDADISWNGGDLIKLVKRPEQVIGATYRLKNRDEKYHAKGPVEKAGDVYRVGGVPGGFLKMDRSVFERLKPESFSAQGVPIRNWFPQGMRGNEYFGEDYGFCQQWRDAGGDVYLDPSIRLKHFDGSMFYTGDPAWWLDANIRIQEKRSLRHCLDEIKAGRDTPQIYQELIAAWGNCDLWTGSPEMLRSVVDLAREADGPIVEFGSGLTTILMRALSDHKITVFDDDAKWGERVNQSLIEAGLMPVDMRIGPVGPDKFYQADLLKTAGASLVVLDGPSDQEARLNGMATMWRVLQPGGRFIFDDVHFPLLGAGFQKGCRDVGAKYRIVESLNGKLHAVGSV